MKSIILVVLFLPRITFAQDLTNPCIPNHAAPTIVIPGTANTPPIIVTVTGGTTGIPNCPQTNNAPTIVLPGTCNTPPTVITVTRGAFEIPNDSSTPLNP